jgi:hypothetical protein
MVREVHVDVIGLEPTQRRLAGAQDMVAAESLIVEPVTHRVEDLGTDDHTISLARIFEEAADEPFAFAMSVAVCCVKEVAAGVQCPLHDPACGFLGDHRFEGAATQT